MKLSKVLHFPVTDSTLTQARLVLEDVMPDTCVLVTADEQTAGQATRNRKWASPPKVNIYATYAYLTATQNDKYLSNIPQVAACSIIEVLQQYGLKPSFKWANDVLLAGKKICGILAKAEQKFIANNSYRAISIGIGLNVNMTIQDLQLAHVSQLTAQATSMKMSTGQTYDKEEVLAKLNDALLKNIGLLYLHGFSYFLPKITAIFETFADKPQWFDVTDQEDKQHIVIGRILGVNEQGHLQLKIDGQVREFSFGRLLKDDEIKQAREHIKQ